LPSYDGRKQEPAFLPAKLPVLLMIGAEGIAVGMATRILPHNLPEILAAQIASESSWDAQAQSPAGAQGLAQFMPGTWEQYGLDGDGDGIADVWNPIDAIHSAAALNCVNARLVADVPGDRLINLLAAYNAGFNNVLRYEGVPPFAETEDYIERILRRATSMDLSEPVRV